MRNFSKTRILGVVCLAWLLLWPAGSRAQSSPTVSIARTNATVQQVLREIERMTEYTFFYNNGDFDMEKTVSVSAVKRPVTEIVREMLPDCTCKIENRRIILMKAPAVAGGGKPVSLKGAVKDDKGAPVVGATVLLSDGGQTKGITTSFDGKFAFPAEILSTDATLSVSFIGYTSYQAKIGNRTFFDVVLTSSEQSIDEVVVVGYGVQKKANLTGAVASISQKELQDRPVSSVGRALQGAIPNLNVTLSSGQPGAGASYNIRGNTSPNGGSPLILIDGVETYPERINSNDIESITVLKDAASAAIYGARGAFGVILITTKSGKFNEKAEVSYNGYFSVSSPTTSTDYETRGYYSAKIADLFMLSAQNTPYTSYTESDYQALWERRNDKKENPARPWVITDRRNGQQQYVYLANFDWYNYLYDDSRPTWDHNINIKGGTKALSYMVSGRYYQQKGVNRIEPDMFKSYNFRVKLQAEIKPWLTIASNTKFFQSNYKYYGYEDEYNNFRKPTLHALASFVPVNPDGTAVSHTSMTQSSTHYLMDGYSAMMQKGKSFGNKKTQEITTTFEATFKLHKNFNVKADFSYTQGYLHNDYRSVNVQYSQYPGEVMTEPEGSFPNKYKEVVWDQNYYVADVYGTYNKTFSEKHNLTLIAGYNYEAKYYRDLTAANDGLLSEDLSDFNLAKGTTNFTLNGGRNEYAIMGWFYRAAYDYKGKYLAEVNGRYDGTSRFPRGKRYGFFPSFSLGWRVSEEAFFDGIRDQFNNLKLRFSYGQLGNQNVGYYDYIRKISIGSQNYLFGGDKPTTATISAPVASDLSWERSIHKNLGVDMSFLNNRLAFSADFYIRDTKDMLTAGIALPATYGADSPKMNSADLRTKGYELSLNWRDEFQLLRRPFSYSVTLTFNDYVSNITKFDNPDRSFAKKYYEGMRWGEIWGYRIDGLFASDEEARNYPVDQTTVNEIINASAGAEKGLRAGDLKFRDLDDNNVISIGKNTVDDPGDREIIGNSQPRYHYGATLALQWAGIDFSIFFQGIGRQDWYPAANALAFWGPYARPYATYLPKNFHTQIWSEENPNSYFPRPRGYTALQGTNRELTAVNDRYLQNIGYCRLKNLTVGYTLPRQWTRKALIESLRIYFTGENLFTWSGIRSDYIDPEMAATNGNLRLYPWQRTYMFGVDVTF